MIRMVFPPGQTQSHSWHSVSIRQAEPAPVPVTWTPDDFLGHSTTLHRQAPVGSSSSSVAIMSSYFSDVCGIIITHDDVSPEGRVFLPPFICVSVCFSHYIWKTDAARITKLPMISFGKPLISGSFIHSLPTVQSLPICPMNSILMPTLDPCWDLHIGPMRQPKERKGIGRCVRCMSALCRVEESTVGVSSLSGISKRTPSRRGLLSG